MILDTGDMEPTLLLERDRLTVLGYYGAPNCSGQHAGPCYIEWFYNGFQIVPGRLLTYQVLRLLTAATLGKGFDWS